MERTFLLKESKKVRESFRQKEATKGEKVSSEESIKGDTFFGKRKQQSNKLRERFGCSLFFLAFMSWSCLFVTEDFCNNHRLNLMVFFRPHFEEALRRKHTGRFCLEQ
jgi:hypothetical protein